MAKQAARKVSVAKKSAGPSRVAASASAAKAKPAVKAAVVAKPSKIIPRAAAVVVAKPVTTPKKNVVVAKSAPSKSIVKSAPFKLRDREPKRLEPIQMPIPEAVPTNGKPRKNQAGLTSRELEHFRDLLLEKRRELVGDMYSMESEALRTSGNSNLSTLPIHMADMGTDNYEQEFTLGLVEKDRGLLREINSALAKIQNGTFGLCEGTGKPISKPRLEAQPWARHSIEYARQLQRPMGAGRGG